MSLDLNKVRQEILVIVDNLKLNETIILEGKDNDWIDLAKEIAIKEFGYEKHTILIESDDYSDEEKYRLIIETKRKDLSIIEDYSSGDKKITLSFSKKNNKDLIKRKENKIHLESQFFVMRRLSHLIKTDDSNLETKETFENDNPFGKYTEKVKKIKYLSLDADDTIFKTSDIYEIFNEEDLKKLALYTKKILEFGISFYINSGRGVKDVILIIRMLEKLGGRIDYAVCENGSVFLDYSKIRKENNLDLKKIEEACVWVEGIGLNEKEVRSRLYDFLKKNVVGAGLAMLETGKIFAISLNPIGTEPDVLKDWLKSFLLDNKKKIVEGLGEESEDLLEAIINKINNSTTAVDLNPCRKLNGKYVGINKSDGIDLFCQQMGDIEMEKDNKTWQIVGMGDSTGDLPVFIRCKWNMVPLNGFKLTTEETREEMKEKNGFEYEIGFMSVYETTKGCNQFMETLIRVLEKQKGLK